MMSTLVKKNQLKGQKTGDEAITPQAPFSFCSGAFSYARSEVKF